MALRDRIMGRFPWLRDRVRARASAELARHLDCLGHAIRGNIDWAANVPRCLAADTPDGVPSQVPIVVTDQPSDTRADLPPFPETASAVGVVVTDRTGAGHHRPDRAGAAPPPRRQGRHPGSGPLPPAR
ncbi:hypothetical protein DFQ13_11657 [Actinokineospora spheciospongiae]|nr:hypothetical protein DFQ13_11657 [Actinokineospora spheciospongiae]